MKEKDNKSNDEEAAWGVVTVPKEPGFTPQFNRITKLNGFKVAKKQRNEENT